MLRITKNRTKANIILARAACLVISFTVLIGITLYNNFAFATKLAPVMVIVKPVVTLKNVPHHQNLT